MSDKKLKALAEEADLTPEQTQRLLDAKNAPKGEKKPKSEKKPRVRGHGSAERPTVDTGSF